MLSVTSTYTVGESKPLWRFGNMPLTIVSQIKSEWGLTKQAMSPKFSSIILLVFLLFLSLFEISSMNLSSKSFWAYINFGTAIGSLSNNINYNKSNHYSIYLSNLVVERER